MWEWTEIELRYHSENDFILHKLQTALKYNVKWKGRKKLLLGQSGNKHETKIKEKKNENFK